MKKLLLTGLCLAALGACTTTDPYTGESKTSNATEGAIVGAFVGALIGAVSGDDDDDIVRGAVAGAAIGGSIGAYYDEQEAELRDRLQGSGVSVTRISESEIRLNMPSDITFQLDSDRIDSSFNRVLQDVALVLVEFNQTGVRVDGHTDSTGSDAYNQDLSQRRASSVASFLQRQGVSGTRLATRGFGESLPVASNGNASGRALNRRVEIQIAN